MRAKLWQLLNRNWPIKLAAVFLAVMLYVAVQLQRPVTENFAMKLDVDVPPGRSLRQKPPTVWVTISGKGTEVLRLRSFPSTIRKAVPDTLSAATWLVRLENADVAIPKGADVFVYEITPREVTLSLDSVVRKDVPVVPLVTVVPESNHVMRREIGFAPTAVRLVGPERELAGIESVTTVPTQLTSVAGVFQHAVAIDTAPLGVVRVSPKEVTVSGETTPLAERTFAGITVESGAGQFVGVTVDPPRVQVAVRGPADRLEHLTRDSVRVVAVSAAAGGYARLRVLGPAGVDVRAIPESVAVRRRGGRSGG
jgi:YbbR domain-containing protein